MGREGSSRTSVQAILSGSLLTVERKGVEVGFLGLLRPSVKRMFSAKFRRMLGNQPGMESMRALGLNGCGGGVPGGKSSE